jgi:hypothetical protein
LTPGITLFTVFHVVLSLAGILSGFVVAFGFLTGNRLAVWNAFFLIATVATSVTGFLFPFHKLFPSHILGILSLIVLAIAIFAYYARGLAGGWRRAYVITAVLAEYSNVFVLIAQLFQKVPALKALAPTQTESPFKIAQLSVLLAFLLLGVFATKNFAHEQVREA